MFNYFNNTVTIENEEFNILDQSKFPTPDIGALGEIFEMDLMDYRISKFDHYDYYGLPVPRTTEIIKECTSSENLIIWAAKIGVKEYYITKNTATTNRIKSS